MQPRKIDTLPKDDVVDTVLSVIAIVSIRHIFTLLAREKPLSQIAIVIINSYNLYNDVLFNHDKFSSRYYRSKTNLP
jgi:hypothetical protein